MATVRKNHIIEGISGMFGNSLVFRQLRGKTIVSPKPAAPSKQSELQQQNRSKFKDATAYAKECMKDTAKKTYYQQKAKKLKLPNAYTAAITDYMRRGKISHVRIMQNDKKNRRAVMIETDKNGFDVKSVTVTVLNKKREVLNQQTISPYSRNVFRCELPEHLILSDAILRVEMEDADGEICAREM